MRVVFMGTPEFAVPSLRAVARDHDVVAVYTRPDSASGRGKSLRPTAVKQAAMELELHVHQPVTLRDPVEHEVLAAHAPDVVVVAAYGLILPQAVLDIPANGCINVHGSLLPRWRGAAPVQRAILAGDRETGVSIMRMEAGLDTGPYCEVARVEIGEMNATQLTQRLAVAGAEALSRALVRVEAGTCEWVIQDESQVTYAEKISKADVLLSPDLAAQDAVRRIRASSPQAPAKVVCDGRGLTLLDASVAGEARSGQARLHSAGVVLGFGDGAVLISTVKPDGKGSMSAVDWARGARLGDTSTWEAV